MHRKQIQLSAVTLKSVLGAAVCHSAEDDRSAISTGQLWSSGFCCCGPVDLQFAARQSS